MKLQFTIRDLLLIIVIAALAAGWWIDHQRMENQVAKISRDIHDAELRFDLIRRLHEATNSPASSLLPAFFAGRSGSKDPPPPPMSSENQ
jgi:hypothetical protein